MTARILCVEDEPINMQILKRMLRGMDYEILEASNGASAIGMAQHNAPDLILMDVNLPDIDGLEATRRIKAMDQLSLIPIVALTADIFARQACIEAGCDAYLNKPISKGLLLRTVQQLLQSTPEI